MTLRESALRGALLTVALVSALQTPAHAYLKLGSNVNGRTISLQCPAVRLSRHDTGVDGVSAPQFREAVGRGFDAWQAVDTASARVEFGGFVAGRPLDQDGANVIGFASRPDMERTLASTSFLIIAFVRVEGDPTVWRGTVVRVSLALEESNRSLIVEATVEKYDVRPGGTYRYIHKDDSGEYAFRGVFHTVEQDKLIIQTFE